MIQINDIINVCSDPALGSVLIITRNIINVICIIVPILLMLMMTINLIQIARDPEEKKKLAKLKNPVIAAVIIFFVPTIINTAMSLLEDNSSISACWNSAYKYDGVYHYAEISYSNNKTKIYVDPDEYEKGVQIESSSSSNSSTSIEGTAQKIGDVVWDSSDLTKKSNLTSTQLVGILNAYGGSATNFIPYASGLITAENKNNVNVFFLVGLNALESGWGTSAISRSCHNLGGVCSSSAHPSNGCGSNSNCSFAYFNSVNDFIDYHANFLQTSYLSPSGAYYEGKDLQSVYTMHYCPECYTGASAIKSIADGLFSKVSSVL